MSAKLLMSALVLMTAIPAHGAGPLGRLFFSPEQRVALEHQRRNSSAAPVATNVTVNGVIQSSGGKSVIWINGVPYEASQGTSEPGFTARPSASTSVTIVAPGTRRSLRIRVGETVELVPDAEAQGKTLAPQPER